MISNVIRQTTNLSLAWNAVEVYTILLMLFDKHIEHGFGTVFVQQQMLLRPSWHLICQLRNVKGTVSIHGGLVDGCGRRILVAALFSKRLTIFSFCISAGSISSSPVSSSSLIDHFTIGQRKSHLKNHRYPENPRTNPTIVWVGIRFRCRSEYSKGSFEISWRCYHTLIIRLQGWTVIVNISK